MFLLELFGSMRARRRSTQQHNEEGAQIARRLRELLDSTKPKQVETPATMAPSGSSLQDQRPLRRKDR